ncbi:unnamed protein product [Caenorhabditis nigoni]|uniref:RING-type domain-containing protein n=1 Tax=Caenorhabditis nigoni TaxID=1611254 RepID=A0A2G5UM35_9PELO|nr:hypothetical protein B9Z55_011914 [Caenorhabditis nigoni]
MSGSIADSEYSRVIEEIFQRIRATGDTVANRALFLEWIDIFQRPGHVVASKSFKALAEMKKESVTSQGETEICAVCYDKLCNPVDLPETFVLHAEYKIDKDEFKNSVTIMPCNHRFHFLCLVMWLDQSQTCPTCRNPVKSDSQYDKDQQQARVDELHNSMYS